MEDGDYEIEIADVAIDDLVMNSENNDLLHSLSIIAIFNSSVLHPNYRASRLETEHSHMTSNIHIFPCAPLLYILNTRYVSATDR